MCRDWIALSDRDGLPADHGDALLDRGTMVMEITLPLQGAQVLIEHHTASGWARTFSIFHDADSGLSLLHRQGRTVVRHSLPGPLPQGPGTARLIWRWDAPARLWSLRYEPPGGARPIEARGTNPLPLPLADLRLICNRDTAARHPAVLWFGVTDGMAPPARAPWLGRRTPIATPTGLRPAGALRVGDMVMTLDSGARALRSVRHMQAPGCGSYTPILLRAPYFSACADMLVSADQAILLDGPEVEYLFGEDEVLVEAQHLTGASSALLDARRPVVGTVSLDVGHADLILSDRIAFAAARHDLPPDAMQMPRHLLQGYEAIPLVSLRHRAKGLRAA